MSVKQIIEAVFNLVRKDENYVPRDYQTIGGMWTVDTWKQGDVTVQLQDEGYTKVIVTNDLQVSMTGNLTPKFYKGTVADLLNLAKTLNLEVK